MLYDAIGSLVRRLVLSGSRNTLEVRLVRLSCGMLRPCMASYLAWMKPQWVLAPWYV